MLVLTDSKVQKLLERSVSLNCQSLLSLCRMNTRAEKRERLYAELALEIFCASSALEGIDYTGRTCREFVSSRRRQLYQSLTSNPDESAHRSQRLPLLNPALGTNDEC